MRLLPRLAVAVLAALSFATIVHAASPQDTLPGHYYLEGATEVGSELLLSKDGKFEWMLSYGAVDQAAKGTWAFKNNQVVLTSGPTEPLKFRLFTEDELTLKKPPKVGSWVAIVGVPHHGPVSDVEVKFETKSGKSETAITDRNGDAIISMPASEQWTRAGLRRGKNVGEWQWLEVPAERSTARIAAFAIINTEAIGGSSFKTMELKMEKGGLAVADDGMRGLYVKRP